MLTAWVVVVALGWSIQWPNDYSAFYFMAKGLRVFGMGLNHQLYSLRVQYELEGLGPKSGVGLAIPFVNPPIAAWIMIPFSFLPLRAAFLLWDAIALIAAGGSLYWLRQTHAEVPGLGIVVLAALASYPTYIALGQGQYDLLWPLGVALAASALTVAEAKRWVPRVAVSALVAAIKPDLLLGLVVPALSRWRDRRVRVFALTSVLFGAAVAVILGPTGLSQAAHVEVFTIAQRFPPTNDITVLGFLWALLGAGHHQLASTLALLAIPVALVLQGALWWRRPPLSSVDWWLSLTSALCVSLLIAPHDLAQGMVLLTPAALWVGLARRAQGRSLGPLAWWIVGFNLTTLFDLSPHSLRFPLKVTPLLLLAAAIVAWRARGGSATPSIDSTAPVPIVGTP
jgi:hypothetical protein